MRSWLRVRFSILQSAFVILTHTQNRDIIKKSIRINGYYLIIREILNTVINSFYTDHILINSRRQKNVKA